MKSFLSDAAENEFYDMIKRALLTDASFRQGWDYATLAIIGMCEENAITAAGGHWTKEVERGRVGAYHSVANDLRGNHHYPK